MTGHGIDTRRIVYEDDWLIVFDKPSGLLVIETPKRERRTLTNLLNDHLDAKGVEANAHPCHRIDRETSGLVIYAKGKSVQRRMMDEFKRRTVKKLYIAFVHGRPKRPQDTIQGYLYNRNKGRRELALTRYRVLESRDGFSVVEAEPITGRTNQIRRQFHDLGHPILGERVWAFRKDYPLKFRRLALHARSIEFTHPMTQHRITLTAELPQDMREFLKRHGCGV